MAILLAVFTLGALSQSPVVIGEKGVDAHAAKHSKAFAKRFFDALSSDRSQVSISINRQELAGLVAITNRTIAPLSTEANLSSQGMKLSTTYDTGLPYILRFVNIEGVILPSQNGIAIDFVKVGRWQIDGRWLLSTLEWGLNTLSSNQEGTELIASIKQVRFDETQGHINIELPESLRKAKPDKPSKLSLLRDKLSLFGNAKLIRVYHEHLLDFAKSQPDKGELAAYFRHVFELAAQRSLNKGSASVEQENQAALLALVVYFGSNKFEVMIGDISNLSRKQFHKRYYHRSNVTLRGRVDLQKHFIYSVALQIFGSMQASDALGEFKELLDVNLGGSGFSFADLMADRAGTRLAQLSTSTEINAKNMQALLRTITDEQLLPDINGLPEGLDEIQFKNQYTSVDAKPYLTMVEEIDNRIHALALYRSSDS